MIDGTLLAPPRRASWRVPRQRLLDAIGSTPPAGVCVVTAGPGFGKTELLADWATCQAPSAPWLTVTTSDNDPVRFWRALTAAFERVGLVGDPDLGVDDVSSFLRNVIEPITEHAVWLMIDDAHLLVAEQVRAELTDLVAHVADRMRLVVASRADLTIGLPRLRARGLVLDIRERDLKFDSSEVTALVASTGLDVSAVAVDRLLDRTEGWAAGVQLALRAALDSDDADTYISTLRGDDRSVADFLLEEALDSQPVILRRFLLETSILDRLTGPLCDAVTGRSDSTRILNQLERNHVLVSRLESVDTPSYQYHTLFTDLLRSELDAEAPATRVELHRRAARWFETAGDTNQAIRHFIEAGDTDTAAALVKACENEYFRSRQVGLLQDWYGLLAEQLNTDPDEYLLRLTWASIEANDPVGVWQPTLHRLRQRVGHTDRPTRLAAEVAVLEAHLAARIGDAPTMEERSKTALRVFDAAGVEPDRPAVAYATMLAARAEVWNGSPDLAELRVQAALAHRATSDPYWGTLFEGVLAYVEACQGRHRDALERAERIATMRNVAGARRLGTLEAAVALVIAQRSLGKIDDAFVAVDEARATSAPSDTGAPFLMLLALEEARLHLQRGDVNAAGAVLASVEDLPFFDHGRAALEAVVELWRTARSGREGFVELTPRELDILRRLPTRLTLQQIADELYVSTNTIKTHVKNIYAKLDVTTRYDAVLRAEELRLPMSRS